MEYGGMRTFGHCGRVDSPGLRMSQSVPLDPAAALCLVSCALQEVGLESCEFTWPLCSASGRCDKWLAGAWVQSSCMMLHVVEFGQSRSSSATLDLHELVRAEA